MPRIVWDNVGERRFESGVDRGVLFSTDGVGVPWNGLTSIKESSTGGEVTPYFLDGVKYLNISGYEDFGGTIEAFTYPDEFGIHDGTYTMPSGLIAFQQRRRPFAFSYRTRSGNDVNGVDNGYKLHIVYNAMVEPSERAYGTIGSSPEPTTFSWAFSTIPKRPKTATALAPLAHVVIDSTKSSPSVLRYVEEQLYGTAREQSRLVSMDELFNFFENPRFVYSIFEDLVHGLAPMNESVDGTGDLIETATRGLFDNLSESRLVPTGTPGFYRLATT